MNIKSGVCLRTELKLLKMVEGFGESWEDCDTLNLLTRGTKPISHFLLVFCLYYVGYKRIYSILYHFGSVFIHLLVQYQVYVRY